MKKIILYTDGACSGNPGQGGWAAILSYNNHEKILSGCENHTTNNRMELMAIIAGFQAIKEPCQVDVYSDSAYVVNAFLLGWIANWIQNDWKTASNKQVQNTDLWQKLILLIAKHKVSWNKVKGHSDNEINNRCDKIAREEIAKLNKKSE